MFKLITANCQPGTNRIKFRYNKNESDFSGFKHPIAGYNPLTDMNVKVQSIISESHCFSHSLVSWDRFYISAPFSRNGYEQIVTYYVVPFLLNYYLIVPPVDGETASGEFTLEISAVIVIADVGLLIVSQVSIFTLHVQSVLIQIVVLIFITMTLVHFDDNSRRCRKILAITNLAIATSVLCLHYKMAKNKNAKVLDHIKRGDFIKVNTV